MIYLRLFWEFFKTGLFAVGGGMATLPFLREMAEKTAWFTQSQLADMIAVADSTPGPLGVNAATYVGFTTAGVLGSVVATLGLILPSLIVILLVAMALDKFKENFYVKSAFYALRPASSGLIAASGCAVLLMAVYPGNKINIGALCLLAVLAVLTNIKPLKKLHPVVFIAISAAAGIIFGLGE